MHAFCICTKLQCSSSGRTFFALYLAQFSFFLCICATAFYGHFLLGYAAIQILGYSAIQIQWWWYFKVMVTFWFLETQPDCEYPSSKLEQFQVLWPVSPFCSAFPSVLPKSDPMQPLEAVPGDAVPSLRLTAVTDWWFEVGLALRDELEVRTASGMP